MDPHNKCMGGRVWCVSDICGIICAVMTWLLVTYAEFVVVTVVVGTANHPIYTTFNLLLFNVFAVLALSSHTRAMFTDPVSGGEGWVLVLVPVCGWRPGVLLVVLLRCK